MADDASSPDRLIRLPEALAATGLTRSNLYRWISRGSFPRPIKFGRVSAWSEHEVQAWIEDRKLERGGEQQAA